MLMTSGTGPASGWIKPRRRPSTYALKEGERVILLDAGSPEAVMDIIEAFGKPECALISHAHLDHWSGINVLRWIGLKTYSHESTFSHPYFKEIADAPFELELNAIEYFKPVEVCGFSVTAFPLKHSVPTTGFLINEKVAYLLDTKGLPEETFKFLKDRVEYVIVDSALPDGIEGPHNTFKEAVDLSLDLGVKKAFLVHLLPTLNVEEVLDYAEKKGLDAEVPYDGQTFKL